MKTIAFAAAIAAAASAIAIPATAQEVVQASLNYGDIDVTSPAGVQTLNARLEATVDSVCERPDNRDIKIMAAWKQCKDTAQQSAIEQLASKGIKLAN